MPLVLPRYFLQSLWSECLYGGLLLSGVWLFDKAREADRTTQKALQHAALTGLLVGVCVLFRGVATYMLPIFCVALIWRRWRLRLAWTQCVVLVLGTILMVGAPIRPMHLRSLALL